MPTVIAHTQSGRKESGDGRVKKRDGECLGIEPSGFSAESRGEGNDLPSSDQPRSGTGGTRMWFYLNSRSMYQSTSHAI